METGTRTDRPPEHPQARGTTVAPPPARNHRLSLGAWLALGLMAIMAEKLLVTDGALKGVVVSGSDGNQRQLAAEHLMAFFGLHPKLGPIAEWGLELDKRSIRVDTEKFQTSTPGIFAVGDINHYPGKKKLILSGFHEAALAAFGIQHHLYPEKKQFLQYTTTSPIMLSNASFRSV